MSRRKNKTSEEDRKHAIDMLRKIAPPGTTVYCILRQLSRSGMQRRISLMVTTDEGPWQLDGWCETAFGFRVDDRKEGIVMGGCGMDMGFALVSELSYGLYPDGFGCIGEKCPSNDHSNGDRSRVVHTGNGAIQSIVDAAKKDPNAPLGDHWHKSGGYALKHRWL